MSKSFKKIFWVFLISGSMLILLSPLKTGHTQETPEKFNVTNFPQIQKNQIGDFVQRLKKARDNQLPTIDVTDWRLILVNRNYPITSEPTHLATFDNRQVDERIIPELTAMFTAASNQQIQLEVVSAYRSVEYQANLFNQSIEKASAEGMTPEQAKEEALRYRTEPGTSEHHTGLAIDVLDSNWLAQGGLLSEDYGQTAGGKWLAKNVATFGFIIRYPENKTSSTFIEYEPWHLRYVGVENAKYMTEHQLSLEEYLSQG